MKRDSAHQALEPLSRPVLAGLLGVRALLWVWLGGRYGFHGDELYYIESAQHLGFGYVDHPPVVVWAAAFSRLALGESLHALRFLPMLAGMAAIALTLLLVRELRGGAWAQGVAGFAVLFAPVYLAAGNMLDIPVFEQVFWTLGAYAIVRSIARGEPKLWLLAGAAAGLGLMTKHAMLLWGAGVAAGLLLTRERKTLTTPWPWAGGLVAMALFSPNIAWQVRHGWPTAEFIRSMETGVLSEIPRPLFALGQLLYLGPFFAPVWLAGLVYLFSPPGARFRLLGWLYLTVFAILLARQAKPYYLAPAYPMLFAAGAVQWERWLAGAGRRGARALAAAAVAAGGLALAPLAAPVLPIRQAEAVIGALVGGIVPPQAITGDFRLQTGWPEQIDRLAAMAAEQRARGALGADAIFLSGRYGLASAARIIDGGRRLPPAYSGHMSWYYWGPPPAGAASALVHGYGLALLQESFGEVEAIGLLVHPMGDGIKYLEPAPIYLCRAPRAPWSALWPRFRKFNHDF